jgi:hypothetical protein
MTGFYNKDSSKVYPQYCYYFDKKQKKEFFEYKNKERRKYDNGDVMVPDTWRYISDTSILIGNAIFSIEKLTEDSFIVSNEKRRIVLCASKYP